MVDKASAEDIRSTASQLVTSDFYFFKFVVDILRLMCYNLIIKRGHKQQRPTIGGKLL
jgi:hypothetical protein